MRTGARKVNTRATQITQPRFGGLPDPLVKQRLAQIDRRLELARRFSSIAGFTVLLSGNEVSQGFGISRRSLDELLRRLLAVEEEIHRFALGGLAGKPQCDGPGRIKAIRFPFGY